MLADGRISPQHTDVPGPDGKRGWGGRCYGKDLDHLIDQFTISDVRCDVLEAARRRNFDVDRRET
jgi:UDP-glucose 6-dehydrogenase